MCYKNITVRLPLSQLEFNKCFTGTYHSQVTYITAGVTRVVYITVTDAEIEESDPPPPGEDIIEESEPPPPGEEAALDESEPPPPGEEEAPLGWSDTSQSLTPNTSQFLTQEHVDAHVEVIDLTAQEKKTRRSYSFKDKAYYLSKYYEIIEEEGDASYRVVAEQLGIHYSLLKKWLKVKDEIIAKAADETLANLKKGRPTTKHNLVFPLLYKKFKDARNVGKKINFKWLWMRGRQIAIEKNSASFTHYATVTFIKNFQVKIRRVQNRKKIDKAAQEPKIREFHLKFREGVVKSGRTKAHYDNKWGRFRPSRRYNVDQVSYHR